MIVKHFAFSFGNNLNFIVGQIIGLRILSILRFVGIV